MILFFFIGLFSLFQVSEARTNFFDTQSGLSSNIVYDIYQDGSGFIWVATDNGLNRFDAYDFKVFYHNQNDSNSINSNIVRKVFEDSNGALWVGTREGLALFDRKSQSFTRYEIPQSFNLFLNDIQFLEKDSNGFFWFLIGESLFNFDPFNKKYNRIKRAELLSSFTIDSDNTVWVLSNDNKLQSFSISSGEWNDHPSVDIIKGTSIFGSQDRAKVFASLEKPDTYLESFALVPDLPNGLRAERILEDSKGNLWIGTINGLFIKRKEGKEAQKYQLEGSTSILSRNIKSIFEDKAGGVWIGTVNGLYHIDQQSKPFNSISHKESDLVVMAIEESKEGLWVNYFNEALAYYKLNGNADPILKKEISFTSKQNQIWDIEISNSSENILWLATEAGLFIYNEGLEEINEVKLNNEDLRSQVIFTINSGKDETYWLGGYERVYQVNANTKQILQIIKFPEQYVGALVQDILEVETGLLIATEGHGLFTYSNESGLENYILQGVSSIWDIYYSPQKKIWIGTNKGLLLLSEDMSIDEFGPKSQGLRSIIVFSITEDSNGILWLGTEKGLVKYSNNEETYLYNSEDGIVNPEFNRRSIFTSKNGHIFSGGMGGVIYFDPSEIIENPNIPNVLITDFKIIESDSSFTIPTHGREKIVLDWNQNTFEIAFTSLNYTNSSQNKYYYALTEHDPDLVDSKGARVARYIRVPSGDYEFMVRGSNNDNVWNEEWASVLITIRPPFWDTIWFKALVALLASLLLWQLYRYRVRQLLEIERVRLRIAGDLHDEIGSGLSGIALAGDILKEQTKKGVYKPELIGKISENARTLATSLDSIVWLIDPNKESIHDLVLKCKSIAQELLAEKNIQIKDEIQERFKKIEFSSSIRRNLYLIFKESVHNVLKHSKAESVEISFIIEKGMFEYSIKDNGVGFIESELKNGHGLQSLRRRAKEINGKINIETSPTKGTAISICVKLP